MRLWKCRFLPVIFSACLLPPARSIAQGQPETQGTTAKPRTPKELKRHEKKLRKEPSICSPTRPSHALQISRSSLRLQNLT